MSFPPLAWFILALGVLWLLLRVWSRRLEDKRQEAREARMAELLAERELLLQSESEPSEEPPPPPQRPAGAEQRCAGCLTVNPADAKTCAGCGLEL